MQKSSPPTPSLTVARLIEALPELDFQVAAGGGGLGHLVTSARIQKLGLALTGYLEYLHAGRVKILGATEAGFLRGLDEATRRQAILRLCGLDLGCVVVTKGLTPDPCLSEEAERVGLPVLTTPHLSSRVIHAVTTCLEVALAPSLTVHGVLLDLFGLGVFLQGESGIGKSECALDLVVRGHRLVSDDVVVIRSLEGQRLIGSGPEQLRFLMEIRGLGIFNIQELFGVSSVRLSKTLDFVIRLQPWREYDDGKRLGNDTESVRWLGQSVPAITLPVAPGRNLAALVEVAVRLRLLGGQGIESGRRFVRELERQLLDNGRERSPRGRPL